MKKIILFDYDDTLVDTFNSRVPAIIKFCKLHYSINVSAHDIKQVWGVPFDEMMHRLGCEGSIDKKLYIEVAEHFPIKAFPESNDILHKLSRGHQFIGILTSLARAVLLKDLTALGWDDGRFKFLYAQEDTIAHKPNPLVFESFLTEASGLNVKKEEVVYIGDGLTDALAAQAAGIDFMGIARTSERREQFQKANISYKLNLVDVCKAVTQF